MAKKEDGQPLSSAEKKRRFREKMRAAGYREIGVWVDPKYADKVREFADSLPKPKSKDNPAQHTIFEALGQSPDE